MAGGFIRVFPARLVVDEIIGSGNTQATAITNFTGQFAATRYDKWVGPFLPPSSSARVLALTAASSNSAITVTTGITNPDFPRAVRVCPSSSVAPSQSVVITGTDQFNLTVTDTINLNAAGATVDGVQPFKTITSIVLPAISSGISGTCNFTIGLTNIFGTTRTGVSAAIAAISGAVNGTREGTLPVVGAPSTSAGAVGSASRASVKFTTSATSSAGATLELLYFAQDTTHI